MKIKVTSKSAFTLLESVIVVAIIGLVAAVAVPHFVKALVLSRKNTCLANLRQIQNAKLVWAHENRKGGDAEPESGDLFGPEKYLRVRPLCPAGGEYSAMTVDENASCNLGKVEGHSL